MVKPFADFISDQLKGQEKLFQLKNKQYGTKDPLANFKNGAALSFGSTENKYLFEEAKNYCKKHIAHVFGKDQTINEPGINESLKDISLYSLILLYIWQCEQEKTS